MELPPWGVTNAAFHLFRLLVALAVTALIVDPAAYARSQPPLSFGDQSALTADCGRLVNGVQVEIRNDSATPQKVHAALGQLSDSGGKFHAPDDVCGGISLTLLAPGSPQGAKAKPPVTVEAGGSTTLLVKALSAPRTGTETYQGSLAAFADSGSAARRDMSIADVAAAHEAVPLVDSRSVTQHRYDPTDDWTVWVPVKLARGQEPSLSKGETVGALSGEGGTTPVIYDGTTKKLTDSTSLLRLHVDPISAGTYTGKLNLAPNTKDVGSLTLTLTSKHFLLLAVACIVVGILLALVIQHYNGYTNARARLLKRVRDTTSTLVEAKTKLRNEAGTKEWGRFDIKDLAPQQQRLNRRIEDRTRWTIIQIDQKIVDDLNAKIDELEAKIDSLESVAADALELEAAISLLHDKRPEDLPPLRGSDARRTEPRMVATAHVLLQGESLTADDLVAGVARIPEMTSTIQNLTFAEAELAHYWRLGGEFEVALRTGEHANDVKKLTSALEGLRHGLWDAADVDELKAVDSDLETAREQITALWPLLPPPAPPAFVEFAEELAFARSAPVVVAAEAGIPPSPPAALVASTDAPVDAELSDLDVQKQIATARNSQLIVIGVSFVVALLTGLSVLYIGKAWGTTWDYVWAIAWGLGTQTIVLTIAGAIDGLGALGGFRHGLGAHAK